jgi:DNA-binding GntR family transcriptional regulator
MPKSSLPPTQSSQSVRERTYRLLRKQLLTGQFGPRQRLTEESLARRLGVSRTPVREALHKLELEGLVSSAGARGFRVPDDSLDDMNELFAIREILEGHALAELSRIVTPNDIDELRQIVEQAEQACREQSPEKVFAFNTRFHDRLYGFLAASRPRLHNLIEDMRQYVLRYRENTLIRQGGAKRSISGHKKILLALELGDPDLCDRIMRAHVREAREDTPAPSQQQQHRSDPARIASKTIDQGYNLLSLAVDRTGDIQP